MAGDWKFALTRIGQVLARVRALASGAARIADDPPSAITEVPLAPDAEDAAIPCPAVDLDQLVDPLPAIVATDELAQAERRLMQDAAVRRSTVSPRGHALIHALVRNRHAAHVIAIDAPDGGVTETIARALAPYSTLYAIGPPDAEAIARLQAQWPSERRWAVRLHPRDSMAFFMEFDHLGIRADLVFLAGSRDGDVARFDLMCAARRLAPGGFIIANGASQAGPYGAVLDFVARHPDWIDCIDGPIAPRDRTQAFDAPRAHVQGTDFIILRAPMHYQLLDDRPRTFGELPWDKLEARGLRIALDGRQRAGTLHVQCVLRGFGGGQTQSQAIVQASQEVAPGMCDVEVVLPHPVAVTPPRDRCRLEPWLIWMGDGPLCLTGIPKPF